MFLTLRALSIAPRFRHAARFALTYILLGASLLIAVPAPSAAAAHHRGRHSTTSLLTVALSGSGTVTSAPGGINCGTSCSASYASGTNVTLTASAATGYSFSGWIGACSGTSAGCTVSMSAARSVAATFSQNVALTAPDTTIQCADSGLAATDLSGQCRSSSTPTSGALEAIDASTLPIP
jgi:uncharacterized repeat protein (TIGR02543 family)